jgi:tetratricopeptide (TPR) repeat protein
MAANNLAFMLEHGGDLNAALSYAQMARLEQPGSPATGDTLAWAYYQNGSYRAAVDLLQEALIKRPKPPAYHYHLGLAYEKLGTEPTPVKSSTGCSNWTPGSLMLARSELSWPNIPPYRISPDLAYGSQS